MIKGELQANAAAWEQSSYRMTLRHETDPDVLRVAGYSEEEIANYGEPRHYLVRQDGDRFYEASTDGPEGSAKSWRSFDGRYYWTPDGKTDLGNDRYRRTQDGRNDRLVAGPTNMANPWAFTGVHVGHTPGVPSLADLWEAAEVRPLGGTEVAGVPCEEFLLRPSAEGQARRRWFTVAVEPGASHLPRRIVTQEDSVTPTGDRVVLELLTLAWSESVDETTGALHRWTARGEGRTPGIGVVRIETRNVRLGRDFTDADFAPVLRPGDVVADRALSGQRSLVASPSGRLVPQITPGVRDLVASLPDDARPIAPQARPTPGAADETAGTSRLMDTPPEPSRWPLVPLLLLVAVATGVAAWLHVRSF